MSECPLCGEPCDDLECYSVEGSEAWICAACVARGRSAGYHIAWLPDRRRQEGADAFRAAVIEQRAIIERQGGDPRTMRVPRLPDAFVVVPLAARRKSAESMVRRVG